MGVDVVETREPEELDRLLIEALTILRDPRFGKGTARPWEHHGLTESEWHERFPAFARNRRGLLYLDPPDHTRVRLVAKAFTPRTVERLRPEIVRLTDQILDGFAGRADGVVDVIAELALTLPMTVIGEMLGVPEDERMDLQPLVRAGTATLDLRAPLDQLDTAFTARGAVIARLEALIAQRRAHPTDQVVFDRLLDRFPVIEPAWAPDDRPTHRDSPVLRGLDSLSVHFA